MSDALSDSSERWHLTRRLRDALLRRESPRFEMSVLVAISGGAGFIGSVILLHAGLVRIPVRYVAAVTIAYAVFLGLLYLWILMRRGRRAGLEPSNRGDWTDLDPVVALDLGDAPASAAQGFSAGGGGFGGSGASGSWGDGGGDVGASDVSDVPLDEGFVLIAMAAAALVLLGASVWIVMTAPSLFAELLLDGVLSAGLYRRLKRLPQRPWLETAVRRTILPFLLAAITLGTIGGLMQAYAPEARSLGGVLAHASR